MGMFKGVQPSGQPRTIRSIIEKTNDAKNFPNDAPPADLPQAKEQWPSVEPTPRREGAAGKNPFR